MALKLTLKQASELLAAAGVPAVEIVETEAESDYTTSAKGDSPVTADTLLMAIDASREAIIAPKVISAKTGEIHKELSGKLNGSLRSALSRATGIPRGELALMKDDEIIEKSIDFLKKTVGGDKEELIKERDTLISKHASVESELNKTWQSKVDGITAKLTEKEIIAQLIKDHNEAKGLPPSANKAALAKQFKSYLDGVGVLKYNEEKDEVEIWDKTNPDKRLFVDAKTQTTYAKPSDYIKSHYTELGIWNEDNRRVDPLEEMNKQKTEGYKPFTPGHDGKPVNPVDAGNAEAMKMAEHYMKQTA